MKTICVINQKGGVGKTTSTYNIAVALVKNNKKVLMIDSDSQSSLTLMTGNNPLSYETNVCNIYQNPKDIKQCIYESPIKNLDMIPSNLNLAKIESNLITDGLGREYKIKNALECIKDNYDYCLIDCPPALSMITLNNLIASDGVVVPCETSALSVYALDDLMETITAVRQVNGSLKLLGVIATRFDKRTISDNNSLDELNSNYNVLGVIKNTVQAKLGIEKGVPVVFENAKSEIAKEYISIANKIEEEL